MVWKEGTKIYQTKNSTSICVRISIRAFPLNEITSKSHLLSHHLIMVHFVCDGPFYSIKSVCVEMNINSSFLSMKHPINGWLWLNWVTQTKVKENIDSAFSIFVSLLFFYPQHNAFYLFGRTFERFQNDIDATSKWYRHCITKTNRTKHGFLLLWCKIRKSILRLTWICIHKFTILNPKKKKKKIAKHWTSQYYVLVIIFTSLDSNLFRCHCFVSVMFFAYPYFCDVANRNSQNTMNRRSKSPFDLTLGPIFRHECKFFWVNHFSSDFIWC